MPIHIWGTADPGEQVRVALHGQQGAATADALGKWSVFLRPEHAGGPYTVSVQASNTITLSDVLVGDVWFASGQSNMEFPLKGFGADTPMKDSEKEIAAATHPMIHLLLVKNVASEYEQRDQDATWTVCSPETAVNFSAVAYFFGRAIAEKEQTPVGLIDASWGGTPVAAWLSYDALSTDPGLAPELAARVPMVETQADVPAMTAAETREDAAAKAAGKPAPKHPWHPQPGSYAPAGNFNGMVAPFLDYTIKGFLWYQGETDSSPQRAPSYERAFGDMITDWRSRWREGDLPFLFVQISSFTSTPYESWGIVREAQRRTLKLANTGMVVSTDIGQADNVHPPDKQTVGARMALAGRAIAYGEKLEYSGPIFREATAEGTSLRVYFAHGDGLWAKGGALQGFEVAGEDQHFHPASASVEDGAVLVRGEAVEHPLFVRYAWPNSSLNANLFNAAGLPASTFTSQRHIPAPCMQDCR
ncbi:sialate O-acetylesterase [Acidipila sp. EB88]|nr:sialate O-acetylesterase [Acidipila sp. EB88]